MQKSEKLDFESKNNTNEQNSIIYKPLSQKRKVFLFLMFIIGIPLSFPTVLPAGLVCTAILLFHNNKKINRLGYLLILLQALIILMYFNLYHIIVT